MSHPRLSLALDAPDALPDAGTIALWNPTAATDLGDLPRARLQAVQGFAPDHAALSARGIDTRPEPEGPYAASIIFLPRAKAEARAILAEAAARTVPGGRIWVDGAKIDGIDSILREMRGRADVSEPIAKAHGKIFSFRADGGLLADWSAEDITPAPGFVTRPGVFSADGVDRGSALLAAALPAHLPGRMADLGAGWGWLSAQVLAREGVTSLDLIEADHAALACARRNVTDPRAAFHWADATRFAPEARYGGIVMNPPFHAGQREGDPNLGVAFIRAAAGMLSLSGTLWMVANRHLPYAEALKSLFHEVEDIGGDGAFRLTRAHKPIVGAAKAATASPAVSSAATTAAKPARRRAPRPRR